MAFSRATLRQLAVRYPAIAAADFLVVEIFRRIPHVNQTTVALTFLVLVQLVAYYWGLAYSVCLSIASTLLYNYYFLPPIGSFTIAEPQNWIALFAFLASAILVSRITESERRQTALSEMRRSEVERLYRFSNELLMEEDLQQVAQLAPRQVCSIFAFAAVTLYLEENHATYSFGPPEYAATLEALQPVARLAATTLPRADGLTIVPLMLGLRARGSIAMVEKKRAEKAGYSASLYDAIGSLLAVALERAAAIDRFSRLEAARESERLRSALLDSVTHELRTPLTAIRAAATSLLSQRSLEEGQRRELFSVLTEESSRLDRLIGQAVEMAQLDSDGIEVRPRPQELQEVIDLALEDCHALLRGRPISTDLPPSLPRVPLDRELIRRVLRHLLENAARYSPAGSAIEVRAVVEPARLLVSIADQGQGIEQGEQAYIFDKFYRGSRQRVLHGTGMGLAIVKAILRAHGGGIEVVSRPAEGATFTFWIPIQPEIPVER